MNKLYELPNQVAEAVPHPKVTVRTAAYNHRSFIEKCIEGVLMQETDFPIEYIIGEDCSTDGTREIVFDYAEKYPEIIRVITSGQNVGLKANNHRCRQATRGEFTAVCEGDDYWTDPKKLQKQIDLLAQHPKCDLCFHPAKINYVDSPGREVITGKHSDENCIIPVKKLVQNYGDFCPTASLIYKSRINDYLGDWYLQAPVGDYFFQILGAKRGGALYLDEVMSVYNKGAHGSWSKIVTKLHHDLPYRYKHLLTFYNAIRKIDEITGYKYHKWLNKMEKKSLLKGFLPFYSYEKTNREKIRMVIRKQCNTSTRWQIYAILLISFLYHKSGFHRIKNALSK